MLFYAHSLSMWQSILAVAVAMTTVHTTDAFPVQWRVLPCTPVQSSVSMLANDADPMRTLPDTHPLFYSKKQHYEAPIEIQTSKPEQSTVANTRSDIETLREMERRFFGEPITELPRPTSASVTTSDEWAVRVFQDGGTLVANLPLVIQNRGPDDFKDVQLPGFQVVWEILPDDPSYSIIEQILSRPKPWKFGHVQTDEDKDKEDSTTLEGSKGTLLQIPDFEQIVNAKDRKDGGGLRILVQALDSFDIVHCDASPDISLALVQLVRDEELALTQEMGQCFHPVRNRSDPHVVATLPTATSISAFLEDEEWSTFETKPAMLKDLTVGSGITRCNINYIPDELQLTKTRVSAQGNPYQANYQSYQVALVSELEYHVWVALDGLFGAWFNNKRLASQKEAKDIILPNLLGLLPTRRPQDIQSWPESFELEELAEEWSANHKISRVADCYDGDILRRSRRLSFVVWKVLETMQVELSKDKRRYASCKYSHQEVLETSSITTRLSMALHEIVSLHQSISIYP